MSPETLDEKKPIADVLGDMSIHPLPEDVIAEDAFILIRCRDTDGDVEWSYRATTRFNLNELLGVLSVQEALLKQKLVSEWEEEEDEDG